LKCRDSYVAMVGALCLALGVGGGAEGAYAQVNSELFLPSASETGGFANERPAVLDQGAWSVGLLASYSNRQLVVRDRESHEILERGEIVRWRATGYLRAAYGLPWGLELGAVVPVSLQEGDVSRARPGAELARFGLGDVRVGVKLTAVDMPLFAIAPFVQVRLPTGARSAFLGDAAGVVHAGVAGGQTWGRLHGSVTAGYRLRPGAEVFETQIDDDLTGGGDLMFELQPEKTWLILELYGAADLSGGAPRAEALLGGRHTLGSRWLLEAAAGAGLSDGFGVPGFRAILGLTYRSRRAFADSPKDSDGDGLIDARDFCPQQREDKDNWEDEDGCPDLDNDHDGFTDKADECPDHAETINGLEDDDGCPDAVASVVEKDGRVVVPETVLFERSRADLRPAALTVLREVASLWHARHEGQIVVVSGHTDTSGTAAFNLRLSRLRAETVRNALVEIGLPSALVQAVGRGEADLAYPGTDARNRRVEFVFDRQQGPRSGPVQDRDEKAGSR